MTGSRDRANDLGPILRQPTENEEGSTHAGACQGSEQQIAAPRHSARMREPLVARDDSLERFDLKVFLYIYGEKVFGTARWRLHAMGEGRRTRVSGRTSNASRVSCAARFSKRPITLRDMENGHSSDAEPEA